MKDFVEEHAGFLCVSDEEQLRTAHHNPPIPILAREVLEVGAASEGYFSSKRFTFQISKACSNDSKLLVHT